MGRFAARHKIPLHPAHQLFACGAGEIDGHPVALAIPRTFMNDSGRAVSALLADPARSVETMVVVYDEMDLPPGRLRLRRSGHDGGHQGVRSIIAALQSEQFCRLRLGIGRPLHSAESADYVLAAVPPVERPDIEQMLRLAVDALGCIVIEGFEAAMNRYNMQASV